MQSLALAPQHFDPIRTLKKRVTIRKGYRDIKPGPMIFRTPDDLEPDQSDEIEVNVERVIFTRAGEMTDKEAKQDGFGSLDEMIEGMKDYYPDFGMDTLRDDTRLVMASAFHDEVRGQDALAGSGRSRDKYGMS